MDYRKDRREIEEPTRKPARKPGSGSIYYNQKDQGDIVFLPKDIGGEKDHAGDHHGWPGSVFGWNLHDRELARLNYAHAVMQTQKLYESWGIQITALGTYKKTGILQPSGTFAARLPEGWQIKMIDDRMSKLVDAKGYNRLEMHYTHDTMSRSIPRMSIELETPNHKKVGTYSLHIYDREQKVMSVNLEDMVRAGNKKVHPGNVEYAALRITKEAMTRVFPDRENGIYAYWNNDDSIVSEKIKEFSEKMDLFLKDVVEEVLKTPADERTDEESIAAKLVNAHFSDIVPMQSVSIFNTENDFLLDAIKGRQSVQDISFFERCPSKTVLPLERGGLGMVFKIDTINKLNGTVKDNTEARMDLVSGIVSEWGTTPHSTLVKSGRQIIGLSNVDGLVEAATKAAGALGVKTHQIKYNRNPSVSLFAAFLKAEEKRDIYVVTPSSGEGQRYLVSSRDIIWRDAIRGYEGYINAEIDRRNMVFSPK